MPWYSKEQPTPFDTRRVEGFQFLHGGVMARKYHQQWLEGKKFPLITLPSGLRREAVRGNDTSPVAIQLFGTVTMPQHANRAEAYDKIYDAASKWGYSVTNQGERSLILSNPETGRGYQITYDNHTRKLADIQQFPQETMDLLDGESRAALPPLYHDVEGFEAYAPIKFFTPDTNWTWYPSAYDGEDVFFGLVSGYEVELGYFTLSELESVRGPAGLRIERDRYYKPRTLSELTILHDRPSAPNDDIPF